MTCAPLSRQFQIHGEFLEAEPYGSGHINDTYCAVFDQGGTRVRYIFQRINHNIFKNPVALMENIQRVTAHLAGKVAGEPDASRRVLTLIPARDGAAVLSRRRRAITGAPIFSSKPRGRYDAVEIRAQAFQAAKAFGRFQKLLADLPAPRLHDTIPDFHHTPKRFAALEKAIEADVANRAKLAKAEIEFALNHKAHLPACCSTRNLPERVTHNDTKFNNVHARRRDGRGDLRD